MRVFVRALRRRGNADRLEHVDGALIRYLREPEHSLLTHFFIRIISRYTEKQVNALIEATGGVNDPRLVSAVENKVLTAPGALAKTAREFEGRRLRELTVR